MDAATANAFVQFIRSQRLVMDYLYVSAAALPIYDYFLMLSLEIQLIWPSPWSYTKILYLAVRYLPLVGVSLLLCTQMSLNVSEGTCKVIWPIAGWIYMTEVILAETILAIRTWAVWGKHRKIGIGLTFLMMGSLVFQCIFTDRFLKSLRYEPRPYNGYRGCFVTKASRTLWVNYVGLTIAETAVLGLMVTSAVRAYQSGSRNKLSNIIHRDSIMFYVYLLCFTIANVLAICFSPLEYINMFAPFEDMLYSAFTCRIIINIRNASTREDGVVGATELHDWVPEVRSGSLPLPLEFRNRHNGAWSQSSGYRGVGVDDDC